MKTLQDFYPYNGLRWEPNGSRSKLKFQCSFNQWALNDTRWWVRIAHVWAHADASSLNKAAQPQ